MTTLPNPRRRLWRTWLKWPRDVRVFAPRIDAREVLSSVPEPAEVAHWSEVILLEDIVIALHGDGTTTRLTHFVTMPYGDENLAAWDDLNWAYDERDTRLSLQRAAVYSPDGKQYNAARQVLPLGAHNRLLKLNFTPLRRGTVVELELQDDRYKLDAAGPAIWANFALHTHRPCRRRRLTAAVAEPFTARVNLYAGSQDAQRFRHGEYQVFQWELRDVPGVETDSWTPPPRDFAPWVDISTLPNWDSVAPHYRRELLPPAPRPPAVQQLARVLGAKAQTPRDRALVVYEYATRDVRYGRHPSELAARKIRDASKMLEDLRGDCKDKSSLMVALLGELGIPAHVVVVLTAVNGRTPMLPSRRFDHAIVRALVDGREMWFDPAAGPFALGDLPQNDQGVHGLLLDTNRCEPLTTPLDPPERQRTIRECRGELLANGDYRFRAQVTANGEKAAQYRHVLQDRNPDHRRRTIQSWVSEERRGAEVSDVEIGDLDNLDCPMTLAYTVHLRRWARPVHDLLLFRIPWAESATVMGPISAAERAQPLQLPPVLELIEHFQIQLPEGFHGYGLPVEEQAECAGVAYHLTVRSENGCLSCERRMEIRGGIVPTDRFAEFKQFWENCARADQADIVLIRRQPHRE